MEIEKDEFTNFKYIDDSKKAKNIKEALNK